MHYFIFGSGFAGLALATELQKAGADVTVIDNQSPFTASLTPVALLTPTTARQARLTPFAQEFVETSLAWMDEVSKAFPFFLEKGLIRPAFSETYRTFYENSILKNNWPNKWAEWWPEERFRAFCPGLRETFGGIHFSIGQTLSGPEFLMSAKKMLQKRGVAFIEATQSNVSDIEKQENATLIYATGFSNDVWEKIAHIKLHPVKGQLDVLDIDFPLPLPVTSEGYVLSRNKRLYCGSSYEHTFSHTESDPAISITLREKIETMLAIDLRDTPILERWTGIRVSTPDRKPIAGKIPNTKNQFLFTGLGSKGLYYAPLLGKQLANHLLHGAAIFKEYDIARFNKKLDQ